MSRITVSLTVAVYIGQCLKAPVQWECDAWFWPKAMVRINPYPCSCGGVQSNKDCGVISQRILLLLTLLLWYILRGLSSSKGLIGGLSSVVQKKQDNRKERKTKRKKKVKKNETKKTRGETEEENSKQTRRRKDRCTSSGLKANARYHWTDLVML